MNGYDSWRLETPEEEYERLHSRDLPDEEEWNDDQIEYDSEEEVEDDLD